MSKFDATEFLHQQGLIKDTDGVRLEPLKGGYWNEVYRVQGNNFDWVLKRFYSEPQRTRLYPMLPDSEALALKTLKDKAIAPDFIAYFPATQIERAVLIYDYVPGSLWQGDLTQIADLMKRFHTLDSSETGFRILPQTPKEILAQADDLLKACKDDELTRELETMRPKTKAISVLKRLSLVHTDAWIGNFIGMGSSLRLIDWQCPGLGDPTEDLWTFLDSGYQQLIGLPLYTETEKDAFLKVYSKEVRGRLDLLRPYYAYRVAAHCVMRIQDFKDQPKDKKAYETVLAMVSHQLAGA